MTSISAARPTVIRNNDINGFNGGAARLGEFMKSAIPTGVGPAKGLLDKDGKAMSDDTVAFQMKSPDGRARIDLAWDKASDKMFMLQGGKMVEVPADVRAAAIDRLSEAGLAGRRSTSMYSQMRDDMVRTKTSSVPQQKAPVMPEGKGNTDAIYDAGTLATVDVKAEPDQPITAEPATVQTEIQQRPTLPLPEKPTVAQKPVEQKPAVEQKPVEPQKPAIAPLPAAFKSKVGAASERDLRAAIEQAPNAKTAIAWVQELSGAKGKDIDGKFGPNTARLLDGEDNVMKDLRAMQLKEPRTALRLGAADKARIKDELTAARDNTRDGFNPMTGENPPYENAVKKMQHRLVLAGEVIPEDGKLGQDTYKAMVRVYGKATADEFSNHLQVLRTEEGA